MSLLCLSPCGVALAAVDWAVILRLERNFAGFAAACAYSVKHFARGFAGILTGGTAGLASLGLVHKAFFLIEILLTRGEYKFLATVLTYESFVFVH